MISVAAVGVVGLGVLVVLVAVAALKMLVTKMVSDELRARVDDLPAAFVGLALRLLPAEMRTYYRPDWEGGLLAAFNDETSRYPVTRFFRSFKFGLSLMVGARQICKETNLIREVARNDERQERLMRPIIEGRISWLSQALCRRTDPDELFVRGSAQRKAAVICRQCPVMAQCAADALDNRVQFGVWGGMTERQRQTLLKHHPEVVSWAEFFAAQR